MAAIGPAGPDAASDALSAALAQSWRANAGAWAEAVRSGAIASRATTDAAILDAIRELRPARLLDLGCGEGWLCRALAEDVGTRVGVDGSEALIALAAERGGGEFVHGDYRDLSRLKLAAGEGFDLVAANFAILDPELDVLLETLGRLCIPGGKLVIQTLHPFAAGGGYDYADGWRLEAFAGFGTADWAPMPWFFRTLESWLASVCRAAKIIGVKEPRAASGAVPLSLIIQAEFRDAAARERDG